MITIRHKETEQGGVFEAWITTPEMSPYSTSATVHNNASMPASDSAIVQAGEMTYKRPTRDRMVIDHTRVFDGFEGQGIARQMVLAAVAFARKEGRKIIPVCTYAQAVLTRTDEYKDVVAKE
ncbi:MAG: N-acetyltransferase [Paludibacteraceae bacterium]|nr:N-acetyltransferase [Paludibacteraceae bacterium]